MSMKTTVILSDVTIHSLKRFKYVLAGSRRFNSTICSTAAWRHTLIYSHFCLSFLPNILLPFRICFHVFRQASIRTGKCMILRDDALYHSIITRVFWSHSFLIMFIYIDVYIWMEDCFLSCNFLNCFIFLSHLKDAHGVRYTIVLIMQRPKSFLLYKYFRS